MKPLFLSLTLIIAGCGSVTQQVKDDVKENSAISSQFVQEMDAGHTTRDLEQEFIRANWASWHSINYAINDVEVPADVKEYLDLSEGE